MKINLPESAPLRCLFCESTQLINASGKPVEPTDLLECSECGQHSEVGAMVEVLKEQIVAKAGRQAVHAAHDHLSRAIKRLNK